MADARTYLTDQGVEAALADAVAQVIKERPASALQRISELLAAKGSKKKGYWFVQVHNVKDADAYGKYVEKFVSSFVTSSPPAAAPLYLAPPAQVFDKGVMENQVIVQFDSLQAAIDVKEGAAYKACIAAAGKPLEQFIARDFRIVELDEGWFKKGKGYWVIGIHRVSDPAFYESYVGRFVKQILEPGLSGCNVIYLGPAAKTYEFPAEKENLVVVEWSSLQAAIDIKNGPIYKEVCGGKDPSEFVIRDFRIIEGQ